MKSTADLKRIIMDPVAQELLHSQIPARLAYVGVDGAPRVVPIWFHWNGDKIVLGTPVTAPKVKALQRNPKVALTIDEEKFPARVLLVRGKARLEQMEGVVPEYTMAAERYLGASPGRQWIEKARGLFAAMVRITIQPDWLEILDFQTRFPSAITRAIANMQAPT